MIREKKQGTEDAKAHRSRKDSGAYPFARQINGLVSIWYRPPSWKG